MTVPLPSPGDTDWIDWAQYIHDAVAAGGGGTTTPDATPTVKGKLQLAGDLGGTAAAPTVPGLATKVDTADAVELAVTTSETLTADPVVSGLAADAGHTHRLPNVDGDGYIILTTADGTPVKLLVVNGIVGAGGGAGGDPPAVAPAQVTGVTAGTPTVDTVPLSWTAPAAGDSPITNYLVQYRLSGDPSWTTFTDGAGSTTSTTVTALAAASGYDFRVAAESSVGIGEWSSVLTVSTATNVFGAFSDDFNRADGPVGNGWEFASVNNTAWPTIVSNTLRGAPDYETGVGKVGILRDLGSPDGTISVDLSMNTGSSDCQLIFRYVDNNNYWRIDDGYLKRIVAGVETNMGSAGITAGVLTVVLDGDHIYAESQTPGNTFTLFDGTDPAHATATKAGIRLDMGKAADDFTFAPSAP